MKRTRDFNTRTTCHYCGVSLIRQATPTDTEPFYENGKLRPEYGIFSYDHKTPHARGGTDDPSNLVTCCMKCNLEKGTSDYSIFYAATAPRRLSNLVLAFAGACKLSLDYPSQSMVDMLYEQANAIYKVVSSFYPNIPPPPVPADAQPVTTDPAPAVENGLSDDEQAARKKRLKRAQW